jgi:ATP-dependent Lon protease
MNSDDKKPIKRIRRVKKVIENLSHDNDGDILRGALGLGVRDAILFPHTTMALFVGRQKSMSAVNIAIKENQKIVVLTQTDPNDDDLHKDNLYEVGILCNVVQAITLPDGTMKVLMDAISRVKIDNIRNGDYLLVDGHVIKDVYDENDQEVLNLMECIKRALKKFYDTSKRQPYEIVNAISDIKEPSSMCDMVISFLPFENNKKKEILLETDLKERLNKLYKLIFTENESLEIEKEIQDKIRSQIDKNHREYYLNEQLKSIKKELGAAEDDVDIVESYKKKLGEKKGLTKEAVDKINEEIKRLQYTPAMSSEAGVIRSYLDLILELPWGHSTVNRISLIDAINVLNKSHYGMDEIKDRVIEYIGVQNRTKKNNGNVLCLFGPPGVGKTTLVSSIAKAMGREYVKIALGGLDDESELRGHRRTYVASMPGKIISAIKKAGVSNPVILLDEIDKMSTSSRGNPASAMLEILDPEQNKKFNDHYLEVNFDLSDVIFIATANSLDFSRPLLDRMEIIKVPSYLEHEKIKICKDYIIKRQYELANLSQSELSIKDDAIKTIVSNYTREAGVRELERQVNKIVRKAIVNIDSSSVSDDELQMSMMEILNHNDEIRKIDNIKDDFVDGCLVITKDNVYKYIGTQKYTNNETESKNMIGIVNGLAYTDFGGDILLIEAVKTKGKGEIKITGKLGDVMQESIHAAYSYVKVNCENFGIKYSDIMSSNVHLHVPEGAVPKDGPSAGVAIGVVLVSLFSNIPIRRDVAMTGEITLRGRVLAIGGLREKLTAAIRSGIKIAIIPSENIKDLEDISHEIKSAIEIRPCEYFSQAIEIALEKMPRKKSEEKNKIVKKLVKKIENEGSLL